MASVNKVTLLGQLGRDPEVRTLADGSKVVELAVATSERWKDRVSGETGERTEWHRVVIFNPNLAEVAERYLSKGRTVYLEGQLQTRKWQDQTGQERYTTEIVLSRFRGELVLLGSGKGDQPPATPVEAAIRATAPAQPPAKRASASAGKTLAEELDDEIPF